MTPEERTEMYGRWSTAELALKARWKELQGAKLQVERLRDTMNEVRGIVMERALKGDALAGEVWCAIEKDREKRVGE